LKSPEKAGEKLIPGPFPSSHDWPRKDSKVIGPGDSQPLDKIKAYNMKISPSNIELI